MIQNILTSPWETLSESERASALKIARDLGAQLLRDDLAGDAVTIKEYEPIVVGYGYYIVGVVLHEWHCDRASEDDFLSWTRHKYMGDPRVASYRAGYESELYDRCAAYIEP